MKEYDVIVIGSGSGMIVVDEAMAHGKKTALVDRGPLGGTCANLGCIPSKLVIYPADRVLEVQQAARFGINATINSIDFAAIMDRMRSDLRETLAGMQHGMTHNKRLGYYPVEGHFTGEYTLEAGGQEIRGKTVFIASGSRPLIPPIKGLDSVDYLTSESVLQLRQRPESLIVIGGGYIAVEYGHFFAAMGAKVTLVEMLARLVAAEEPEISTRLQEELGQRMTILLNTQAQEVKKDGRGILLAVKDRQTGAEKELGAEAVLVAVGRRSNADLLHVEETGVELDEKGFIRVNQFLETNKPNILAVGDINGRQMFTHMANRQAMVAGHNVLHPDKMEIDFNTPPPHAIYSHPQVAAVGLTEAAAKKSHKVLVGKAGYYDTAAGQAMLETRGFAKAIVEKDTQKILGFHVVGPLAPIVIQEVINVMAVGGEVNHLLSAIHIHPALPELITRTLDALEEV